MGIYGGIYILPNGTKPKIIEKNLESEKFKDFVKTFGEHRNGNWYLINSRIMTKYLNYLIDCEELFESKKLRTSNELVQIVKEKGAELKFSELEDERQVLDSKLFFEDTLVFNNYQEFIRKCSQLIDGFFK